VPENWVNTYNQWMNNIQDWCISASSGGVTRSPPGTTRTAASTSRATSRARAQAAGRPPALTRDPDVLDTWYSSALCALLDAGLARRRRRVDGRLRPLPAQSTVLVTGFDIIFFWVARMIMMTTHFTGRVPFRTSTSTA
jgi:valyl-tRNA synthetase